MPVCSEKEMRRLGLRDSQFRNAVLQWCSCETPSHEPGKRKHCLGGAVGARLDLVGLVKNDSVPPDTMNNRALVENGGIILKTQSVRVLRSTIIMERW